ncbi:hypothetical protein BH747_02015 [Enterococcus villorum]|uniref:Uncharacterized protein n=1 Tax=Enterococcus villorum TaxID=112904 RepID=A0A1V8YG77_9ENTE|nr:hypothetical protein [Enterococcus villorum]OQO71629.1 hypothetical protein BH747_02015 [Enterococcus villorum]OQO76193.1 hypothetical protein BH744_04420 [Enterococcus villorum]
MFFTHSGLTRRQINQICEKFQCHKNEFSVGRFEDGYLVTVKNKEYKIKFSTGRHSQIVYAKAMVRVPINQRKQVNQ